MITQKLKKPGLGFKIGLHSAVEIEMVLRQVCENSHIKIDPVHPFHRNRVRGNLHHRRVASILAHAFKHGVDFRRFRRGARGRDGTRTHLISNGAQQPGLKSAGAQNIANHIGRCGFPVCSGDTERKEPF